MGIIDKKYIRQLFAFLFLSLIFLAYCQRNEENAIAQKYISNLTPKCLQCLCSAATGCDMSLGCVKGYCGPYKISKLFWIDGGRPVLPEDDVERAGAFEDCALAIGCAQKVIINYLEKYAKDCNDDGVVDCNDYLMINFNGGYQCSPLLSRNEAGRNFSERFGKCYRLKN